MINILIQPHKLERTDLPCQANYTILLGVALTYTRACYRAITVLVQQDLIQFTHQPCKATSYLC